MIVSIIGWTAGILYYCMLGVAVYLGFAEWRRERNERNKP